MLDGCILEFGYTGESVHGGPFIDMFPDTTITFIISHTHRSSGTVKEIILAPSLFIGKGMEHRPVSDGHSVLVHAVHRLCDRAYSGRICRVSIR